MIRVIKSSTSRRFRNIDSVDFAHNLFTALKQLLPKNCYPKINPQYNEISVEKCSSKLKLAHALSDALQILGYTEYDIKSVDDEGYDIAAAKGEAFVKIGIDYYADDHEGYLNFKYDNGNIILQDWYDDSMYDVTGATEADGMPAGYLKTSRFTAPSIKTDEQRNALEAFEIAISQKFKQFESMCDRQFYLTSDSAWTGSIYQYERGYYIQLEATRSNFSAFVEGDDVIRKPRNVGELLGRFDVSGNSGKVDWMSSFKPNRK